MELKLPRAFLMPARCACCLGRPDASVEARLTKTTSLIVVSIRRTASLQVPYCSECAEHVKKTAGWRILLKTAVVFFVSLHSPASTIQKPWRRTIPSTWLRSAPRAMRMPISLVLWLSRVPRIAIASFQLVGLLLFSASAPTRSSSSRRWGCVPSGQKKGGEGEHASPHGINFHAHLDGHSHDSGVPRSEGERQRQRQEVALNISHGRLDSPRVEPLSRPLLALAYTVELGAPSAKSPALAGPGFDVYRPPPLLFRKPARAPPPPC